MSSFQIKSSPTLTNILSEVKWSWWITVRVDGKEPIRLRGPEIMATKKKNTEDEQRPGSVSVWMSMKHSPVAYQSAEGGCSITLPVGGTTLDDYENAGTLAEEMAADLVKSVSERALEILAEQLRELNGE